MSRLAVVLCLVVLLTLPLSLRAQEDASWCVSVWYPSSDDPTGGDSVSSNLDVIDVINPFWYTPSAEGGLVSADPHTEDAEQLAAWREAGFVILPSIFSSLWTMIDTAEEREAHVAEIVALVERMDYDGIDIDYEGFALSTRDMFSEFIEALAEGLHAEGRLLSVTVHPKTQDAALYEGAAAQDWTRLSAVADVFNIMTYDYTSRNEDPGPIAPVNWVHDVLAYAETVTSLDKVRMGLPFYGYSWLRGNPPATTVTWAAAQRLIESFELDVLREPDAMEAHVLVDVPRLPDQTIYFADATQLEAKLAMVRADFPTLGGVAIWGLGGEDPANWDALRDVDTGACAMAG
ncbi:MAG: glycosyl hydrolase family 18 protein [Anaerolineae bacterium]